MNQCTWILEKHNFFIFEEINSIILILAVLPFCTLTADLIALSSHIRKNKEQLSLIMPSVPSGFYRSLSYPYPSCLFSWQKIPALLNHSFQGSFPDPLSPSSPFLNAFQFCLSIVEMWRGRSRQDCAVDSESHDETVLFSLSAFGCSPTAWAASMVATELLIEACYVGS